MKSYSLLLLTIPFVILLSCNKNKGDYDATGSFEATEIIVSSQANGKILSLDFTEGDQLEQGKVVGVVDSTQLYLQKMSLLSNAKGVRAQQPDIQTQTAVIQDQIKTLEREKARVERLIAANAANQKQLDDIESQIEVLQSQLSAQTSTLRKSSQNISAQSSTLDIQIAKLNDQLEKTRIVSPITGTVLNRFAEAGELATMGTPLFKIANLDTMYLRAYVTNDQLAKIKLKDEVTVRVDDGEGGMKTYQGTISWISNKSEFTPKTIQTKDERANLVYALKITVPNDGFLKIGMYGEVKF
ncbi:MAG: HlyD family efflux transporter periplasmic adaptor subunit [Dysgonamonadaceae bacterium]|nr:HlyD family efflux transporter periplasmic adaptor subunit [Dysgonamonadaceae bacterium]MDD3900573.1 HlyD family efflux transporter periplasmic adaptor subunit [Dysgonamonadaceae bacterium]MDD4398986.1 HlyD family efflux transporter periplasmic adaptor subunit [Dysgonamonadaceae bacterium]